MILILSNHDYGNFSHLIAESWRTIRSDIQDYTIHPHKFEYESQSMRTQRGKLERKIQQADQIHIMHSDPYIMQMVLKWAKTSARLIHWATGSRYRQSSDKINRLFNPYVEKTVCALTELVGLGGVNPVYIAPAIDTGTIKKTPRYEGGDVQIYHLPSDPITKGTSKILGIIRHLKGDFNFEYKLDPVPYRKQIELMRQCDIYLELFAPTQHGKPYGSWGMSALEAAAMGKVVFTMMNNDKPYIETYGKRPEMFYSDSSDYWIKNLNTLIEAPSAIRSLQTISREWVVENHSFHATGKKIQQLLG